MEDALKRSKRITSIKVSRDKVKRARVAYYKGLFMNNYIIDGVSYQQRNFIMNELWNTGCVACIKSEHADIRDDIDKVVFVKPIVFDKINQYYYYTTYQAYNPWGNQIINTGKTYVLDSYNEDDAMIIGWAQRNQLPVWDIVEPLIEEWVDDYILLKYQRFNLKMPWAISCPSESQEKFKNIITNIYNDDELALFLENDEAAMISLLNMNPPFFIDKIRADMDRIDSTILTILGINNVKFEKKERLVTDEVDSNNEEIETNENNYIDEIKEFFKRVNAKFNTNISIRTKEKKQEKKEVEDDKQ